jgi:hypothetical protein
MAPVQAGWRPQISDAAAAVVRLIRHSFLLRSGSSAPLGVVGHLVLLLPFAFQRALPRLLLKARSWLQGDVCFLCWPPGFPAVPPYLAHTWAALLQLATTSAVPPLLHQTSGGSVPRPFGAQVEVRSFPRTVSSFKRVATRRDFSYRIAPTGSLGREERPPRIMRASFRPRSPAQHLSSPMCTRSLRTHRLGASALPADWPSLERLIHGFVIL